jgi:membrane-bound metal-dependent hydrolase YbcI (DUF457 family)
MDPLTHMVTGALVAQSMAPDEHRWAFALVGAGAGVVPDIDFVARKAGDRLLFLKLHRGFTHSLLATPLIGACAAGAGLLLFGTPLWTLLWASLLAAVSHLSLDTIMHSTGLQLLWPWRRKFSLHLVVGLNPLTSSARCGERSLGVCLRCTMHSAVLSPLVLLLWAGFVASLAAPWWRALSAGTLAVAATYLALCQALRWRAGRLLAAQLEPGAAVRVFSGSFNPRFWVGVAPHDGGHRVHRIDALGGTAEVMAQYGPSDDGPAVRATRETPTVEEFFNNAVFPHATVYPMEQGQLEHQAVCRTEPGASSGRRLARSEEGEYKDVFDRRATQPSPSRGVHGDAERKPLGALVVWRDLAFAFSPSVSLFAARLELDPGLEVRSEEFRERWDRAPETL